MLVAPLGLLLAFGGWSASPKLTLSSGTAIVRLIAEILVFLLVIIIVVIVLLAF